MSLSRRTPFILAALLAAIPLHGDRPGPDRPISQAAAVFAVYAEDWTLTSNGDSRLVLALWDDDRIVWSEDQARGGAPYRSAQLQPGTLREFLTRLKNEGRFGDRRLLRPWVTWDSRFTTILARANGHELRMRWGSDVESAEPAYQHFRAVWDQIRRRAERLIPAGGVVRRGDLVSAHGVVSWRDSPR
jgi:hypothetical protein